MIAVAKKDDNKDLHDFAFHLEGACIKAVESGSMTKDLALVVENSTGEKINPLTTRQYLDVVKGFLCEDNPVKQCVGA